MAVNIDGDGLIALGGTSTTQGRLRLAEDTDNGTNFIELTAPALVASDKTITFPDLTGTVSLATYTIQVFTSGSGTYTTPAGCKAILVELVGGGGGGGGGGGTLGTGVAGGNTTFSTLTGSGGGAGNANNAAIVAGGAASGGDVNLAGGNATGANGVVNINAGAGGVSFFGCSGAANSGNTPANSGSGGGGGAATVPNTAGGGSAGGYVRKLFISPAATLSYAVGAGGAGGVGSQTTGGSGAAGIIIVTEYY